LFPSFVTDKPRCASPIAFTTAPTAAASQSVIWIVRGGKTESDPSSRIESIWSYTLTFKSCTISGDGRLLRMPPKSCFAFATTPESAASRSFNNDSVGVMKKLLNSF
jgi:hypothetical protein